MPVISEWYSSTGAPSPCPRPETRQTMSHELSCGAGVVKHASSCSFREESIQNHEGFVREGPAIESCETRCITKYCAIVERGLPAQRLRQVCIVLFWQTESALPRRAISWHSFGMKLCSSSERRRSGDRKDALSVGKLFRRLSSRPDPLLARCLTQHKHGA